jgi:hypothetical protein
MGIDATDRDDMVAIGTKIVAEMTEALRDRTTDLGEGVARRLARRHAQRTRPVAIRPLAALSAIADAATIPVRWRHGLVADVASRDGQVHLKLPDRTISFPAVCADALAELHRGSIVSATQLPGLDAADGEVVIRRLLREAVVVPAEVG